MSSNIPNSQLSTLLPPGYKQTDVGVIPEEWEVKSVCDLGQIKTGPFGTLLKAEEYSGSEGVPLISVGEVGAGTFKVTEHTPRVPAKVIRRLPQYVLRCGDIVFGRKGAVERSALVTEKEDGCFLGSDGISIRPQRSCHPPYLACQFQRHEVQAWLVQNATGTTMASLNQGILSRVQIPYAPLPEQRAIAEALSDVDALLGALDRLIAKKRDLKQATMQQLLTPPRAGQAGQTRLPGFKGEWEVKRLGEVAEMRSGGTPSSSVPAYYDGDIPWVSISDMTKGGKVISNTERNLTNAGFANSAAQMFPDGTVLYAMYASLGECSIAGISLCSSQAILGIRPKGNLDREFLYYFLVSLKPIVKSLGQQGTQANLNKKMVQDFLLPFPPFPEQTAIAGVLSDMDVELAALEQRRKKTRALKQGMMQELLTGKKRLVANGTDEAKGKKGRNGTY